MSENPNPIHQAAAQVSNYLQEVEKQLAVMTGQRDQFEHLSIQLQNEVELLRKYNTELQQRHDYFQRHCVELVTKLRSAGSLILDTLREEPLAPFKPQIDTNSPAMKELAHLAGTITPVKDDGSPVPSFLTSPRQGETK